MGCSLFPMTAIACMLKTKIQPEMFSIKLYFVKNQFIVLTTCKCVINPIKSRLRLLRPNDLRQCGTNRVYPILFQELPKAGRNISGRLPVR